MTGLKRSIISIAVLLVLLLGTAGYLAESFLSGSLLTISDENQMFNSLSLFLLINLNIIVILFLVFLVIKNIVKLVLERRNNIIGSALRTRLVLAFVGLSFFPTLVLFLIARGIIGSVMGGWFSPQIEQSFERLQNVARVYYDTSERNFRYQLLSLEEQVSDSLFLFGYNGAMQDFNEIEEKEAFERYLEGKRSELGFAEILIMTPQNNIIARAVDNKLGHEITIPNPNKAKLQEVVQTGLITRSEQSFSEEFIRGYSKIQLEIIANTANSRIINKKQQSIKPEEIVILIATYLVPPELSIELSQLMDSFDDYFEVRSYRRPITSSYLLLLVGGTFLIIFVAIWVGFKLAANISEPIKLLAEGTQQLARGNLSYIIPHVGDDELGTLVESFNLMTTDLKKITDELVSRRLYMETVLESVDIGVISLDAEQKVTTMNKAAARIIFLSKPDNVIGKSAKEIVAKDIYKRFRELHSEMEHTGEEVRGTITVTFRSDIRHVEIVLTPLFDSQGERLGTVVLMDDLSELVKAQRMAAWRDVARRIAHEIKNPLTPIQLSAERIQRRFAKRIASSSINDESFLIEDYMVLKDCTNIIVSQVQTLRNLVNEFSRFARMPKANLAPVAINELIIPLERMYQEAHPTIIFDLDLDHNIPVMDLDKDQINRVLINLLDNAVTAVKEYFGSDLRPKDSEIPTITVKSSNDSELGIVTFAIHDNGIGIKESERIQVFEPYFSNKKGGTGLGLAIVASIVSDHSGFVRVRDNNPHGAIFIIELPARRVIGL